MKKIHNIYSLFIVACLVLSVCVHLPAYAVTFDIPQKVSQGRGFLITIQDNSAFSGKILWQKKEIPFQAEKKAESFAVRILLGMPIDAATPQTLTFFINDKQFTQKITPLAVNWVTHKLTVAPKYVEPPKEVLDKIQKDRAVTREILATVSNVQTWKLPFTRPVKGTVSGSFAARRIFNNVPRSPHLGTDMRGAVGTPILAMADGTVLFAEEQYYSGNAVWIDHGQGVLSMYGHLSKFSVKKGDTVKQGQKIGEVGATGRVTGPHLHLSLYIQGVAVDAVPFFRTDPLEIIGGPTKEEPRPQPKKNKTKQAK